MAPPSAITASVVFHELKKKISYVTLTWDDEPEKKLSLPIPYGTKLDDVVAEAEKALHAFAAEMAGTRVKTP
jgi:hypothetical protein